MKSILFLITVLSLGAVSADTEMGKPTEANIQISSEALQAQVSNYGFYNFGLVPVNSHNRGSVTVRNNSNVYLRYSYSNTWGFEFNSNDTCFPGLNPGQMCWVNVTYWPNREGFHTGETTIRFTSENPYRTHQMSIRLQGQAIRR